jgi:hypothetical protein
MTVDWVSKEWEQDEESVSKQLTMTRRSGCA